LAPNDKQQLEPMLGKIGALPEELGEPETLLADAGLWSWRHRLEVLRQGRMMRLTAHGDQWFDP
jgi:hypothetical protein